MNDTIEKEVQEVKNFLSTLFVPPKKRSTDVELATLLEKARVIKAPKQLSQVLKKPKRTAQRFDDSKKKSFSIFKRKDRQMQLDFEKAIQEIEKCCHRQDFKLDHIRKILSEQKLSLKDLVYYKQQSTKSTQKQLHSIGQLIKRHYGESSGLKAIDLSSNKKKRDSSDVNWRKEDFDREYTLTRITDFNKSK